MVSRGKRQTPAPIFHLAENYSPVSDSDVAPPRPSQRKMDPHETPGSNSRKTAKNTMSILNKRLSKYILDPCCIYVGAWTYPGPDWLPLVAV